MVSDALFLHQSYHTGMMNSAANMWHNSWQQGGAAGHAGPGGEDEGGGSLCSAGTLAGARNTMRVGWGGEGVYSH